MSSQIQKKSSNGIQLVPLSSEVYENRIVIVTGEINEESAIKFCMELVDLAEKSQTKPVTVIITSPGGEVDAGLAMYDAILAAPFKVNTICIGRAYSMAGVLLLAGTGKRLVTEHSRVMLHQPLVPSGAGGSADAVASMAETLQKMKGELNEIISLHTKKKLSVVEKATSFDHYFSAQEAFEFGIVDGIGTLFDLTK